MNNKFDELSKALAQSVTRRSAVKKFGAGLAGMALALIGLTKQAQGAPCRVGGEQCSDNRQCCSGFCYIQWWPSDKNHTNKFGICGF